MSDEMEKIAASISRMEEEIRSLRATQEASKGNGSPEDSAEPFNGPDAEIYIEPASTAGVGGSTTEEEDCRVEVERKRDFVRITFAFGKSESAAVWLERDLANAVADMIRKAAR